MDETRSRLIKIKCGVDRHLEVVKLRHGTFKDALPETAPKSTDFSMNKFQHPKPGLRNADITSHIPWKRPFDLESGTGSAAIITGPEEILSKLTKRWGEILEIQVPDTSLEKWRWQRDNDGARPVRSRPTMTEPRVELKNGRWCGITNKKEKEIIVDSDVPSCVLFEWKRRGNLTPEEWEAQFLQDNTGITRKHLRALKTS
jgi:hypothetical protein